MPSEIMIDVVFIDASTDEVIGRTELSAGQLPETFQVSTQLQLGDTAWSVVRAEPATSAEFLATRQLRLTLQRTQLVPAQDILYSLPTICDHLPSSDDQPGDLNRFEMHEDDWRQVEFVSREQLGVVQAELAAIRDVFLRHSRADEDGRVYAFDTIHIRAVPAMPMTHPAPRPQMQAHLPQPSRWYSGIGFAGSTGIVSQSFAVAFGSVVLYGVAADENVTMMGLNSVSAIDEERGLRECLAQLVRDYDLLLVDWPRCSIVTL